MSPATHHLLRALYLHAMAPSTANQDAVRAAGAALDTETARALNAPRRFCDTVAARAAVDREFREEIEADDADALPIAEAVSRKILDRAAFGLRKYGVSLDDAGHSPVALLTYLQEELMDGANYVEAFKRALMANAAPVEPPHAAAPALATLTPEPAEAVLGRATEALAGVEALPVWVEFEPGVRHPYGDAAFHVAAHVTPDGKARLFPSREAANVWLCANGTWPA